MDIILIDNIEITKIVTGDIWNENCYLVRDIKTNDQILIDPGDNTEDIIKEICRCGNTIKDIYITHAHHDHLGAAKNISAHFNTKCIMNNMDRRLLLHAPLFASRFANRLVEIPTNILFVDDETTFKFSNISFIMKHTPGHTPGSSSIIFEKFIFTGDLLLYKKTGRTDLPGGNKSQLHESIESIFKEICDSTIIFMGHGQNWNGKEAREWWTKNYEGKEYAEE